MSVRCASCGVAIGIDADTEASLRSSGSTFYCHAGHPQSFRVKPDPLIAEIEGLNRTIKWQGEALQEAYDEREQLRFEARTCPVCGERRRTRNTMLRHLLDEHVDRLRAALGDLYVLQQDAGELAIDRGKPMTSAELAFREAGQLDVIRQIDRIAGAALEREAATRERTAA